MHHQSRKWCSCAEVRVSSRILSSAAGKQQQPTEYDNRCWKSDLTSSSTASEINHRHDW